MSILQKHMPFVKEQIAFQGRMADKFHDNEYRRSLHQGTQEKFAILFNDIEEADRLLDAAPVSGVSNSAPTVKLSHIRLSVHPEEWTASLKESESF